MEIYSQKKDPFIRWFFALGLLVLFIITTILMKTGASEGIDSTIMADYESIRDPFLTTIMKGITFFANTLTIIILCLALLVIPKTRMLFGVPVTIITAVTSFINFLLKISIGRERPDEALRLVQESGFSFPSGHTITALVFYISLMILLRRFLIIRRFEFPAYVITGVFSLLAFLIGLSRIYLGVHYPTDVFAGWCLGGIMLIIGVTLYDYMYPVKFLITYDPPAWGYIKKKRPWRVPVSSGKESEPIDIPKFRSTWRKPKLSPKAERERQAELENEAKSMKPQESDPGPKRAQEIGSFGKHGTGPTKAQEIRSPRNNSDHND